jgi:transposase-like protein
VAVPARGSLRVVLPLRPDDLGRFGVHQLVHDTQPHTDAQRQQPLWEGSTENATLARSLLADLVDRGLDPGQAIVFVLDGGKALRRAIKDVFGEYALVHRCHRHKERNVLDLLPERDRPRVLARIRGAWR